MTYSANHVIFPHTSLKWEYTTSKIYENFRIFFLKIIILFQLFLKLLFNGHVSLMVILSVPDSNSPEKGSNGCAGAGTGAFGTFMGTGHLKKIEFRFKNSSF